MPVVRNQTFVHIMDWLKLASSENGVNSNVFPLVKDVIIAGIIDIWSAIRNTCVAKLSKFLELFTLPQVEEFYQSLVKVHEHDVVASTYTVIAVYGNEYVHNIPIDAFVLQRT